MAAEPLGEHTLGSAIIKQIDRSVRLKIHQQRAIAALLAAQGDIVNTEDTWATLEMVILERMRDPQERVRADRQTGLERQTDTASTVSRPSWGTCTGCWCRAGAWCCPSSTRSSPRATATGTSPARAGAGWLTTTASQAVGRRAGWACTYGRESTRVPQARPLAAQDAVVGSVAAFTTANHMAAQQSLLAHPELLQHAH